MEIKFNALIKQFTSKSLVSLDKSYQVTLESEDPNIKPLIDAPADQQVEVTITFNHENT